MGGIIEMTFMIMFALMAGVFLQLAWYAPTLGSRLVCVAAFVLSLILVETCIRTIRADAEWRRLTEIRDELRKR